MNGLRIENLQLPGAELGPENPLPPLVIRQDLHVFEASDDIPQEIRRNIVYGHLPDTLPYTTQDSYTRDRHPRCYKVAVLENDLLRATFLLEYGGRLWSLVHKPSGRELLYVNPVLQPANLALRNAWFSGGVEWNVGTIGHSPFTCSPIFAARVEGDDGTPILRLYEWERIRQVAFQIDACLPDGSPVLYILCRIRNPHDHEIPMYWWSNIAVPESADTRVLVPAETAYRFGYEGEGLRVVPVPIRDGTDLTYSTKSRRAVDYFFHIPDGERPWITALDGEGKGLIQVSTRQLKGRKLFLWGTGPGGQSWQRWLSGGDNQPYIEIQAGLARTQLEHLPMPPRADWTWLEGYGLLEADPDAVHGADWSLARQSVTRQLDRLMPATAFDHAHARGQRALDRPPVEILWRGSGWGALERLRREAAGEPPFCSAGLVFDQESLQSAQAPWIALLQEGRFPSPPPDEPPAGYLVQAQWQSLLEDSLAQESAGSWLAWLHLGVMRFHAGDRTAAREAWQRSYDLQPTSWALRNLAVLDRLAGLADQAADRYLEALHKEPSLLPLAIEAGQALLAANRAQTWLELLDSSPALKGAHGRLQLLEAQAALATGDLPRAGRLIESRFIPADLREGEMVLSELWWAYHARRISAAEGVPIDDALLERLRQAYPVPAEWDFSMMDEAD